MKKDFSTWIGNFKKSIADWRYYTNFEKVYTNVDSIKMELNLLNSLINSDNIEQDFIMLIEKYPSVLKAIPILLAKRGNEVQITDKKGDLTFDFAKPNYTINEYIIFMHKTGLFDLLQNHIISDLTDYVRGIEVGLDTNARKNRTGTAMENIVESFIIDAGFIEGKTYFKEMKSSEITELFGIELNLESIKKAKAEKRFDFVVVHNELVYAIEVNFYSGGGSKLNETARSYKMLAQESKDIKGFKFVWITDGFGWNSAKRNLEETFDILENIFNLQELETNSLNELLK